ncbi:MAG: stage III sporulation protein AF [Clostridia bacterium]
MITIFKQWIYTIIGVSIFSILIELILPKGNLKKYIYVTMGMLMLAVIISPCVNMLKNENIEKSVTDVLSNIETKNGDMDLKKIEEIGKEKDKLVMEQVVEKLTEDIKKRAVAYSIDVDKVQVNINEKYEIEKINIYSKEEIKEVERIKSIIKYIAEAYNVDNKIINIKCEVD